MLNHHRWRFIAFSHVYSMRCRRRFLLHLLNVITSEQVSVILNDSHDDDDGCLVKSNRFFDIYFTMQQFWCHAVKYFRTQFIEWNGINNIKKTWARYKNKWNGKCQIVELVIIGASFLLNWDVHDWALFCNSELLC